MGALARLIFRRRADPRGDPRQHRNWPPSSAPIRRARHSVDPLDAPLYQALNPKHRR
jgi:hypothetical protein